MKFSNEIFNEKIYLEKIMLSTLLFVTAERLFTNVRPHEIILAESKVYHFSISSRDLRMICVRNGGFKI